MNKKNYNLDKKRFQNPLP